MAFFRIYVILLVPFSLILVYREFYFPHTSRRTRFSSMEIIRTAADGSRSPSCCFFSAALRIIRYSFVDRRLFQKIEVYGIIRNMRSRQLGNADRPDLRHGQNSSGWISGQDISL